MILLQKFKLMFRNNVLSDIPETQSVTTVCCPPPKNTTALNYCKQPIENIFNLTFKAVSRSPTGQFWYSILLPPNVENMNTYKFRLINKTCSIYMKIENKLIATIKGENTHTTQGGNTATFFMDKLARDSLFHDLLHLKNNRIYLLSIDMKDTFCLTMSPNH